MDTKNYFLSLLSSEEPDAVAVLPQAVIDSSITAANKKAKNLFITDSSLLGNYFWNTNSCIVLI